MINQSIPVVEKVEHTWQQKAWLRNIGRNSFAFPAFGPGTFSQVGKQILEKGLELSTGDQMADLLYPAYCTPEVEDLDEFANIRYIMRNRGVFVGNTPLWTDKGVYVTQNPTARRESLTINELEKALKNGREFSWGGVRFSEDKRVRFAPKGSYRIGYTSPEDLAKDGFMIASHGEEGAEKLAEVAGSEYFRDESFIHGLDIKEGQEPKQAIYAVGDCEGDGLDFYSGGWGSWDDLSDGYAFGVEKAE